MNADPTRFGEAGPVPEAEHRDSEVRRYASRVTITIIVLCNTVLLLGLWTSGIDLDRLIRTPDVFDPKKDVCLRVGWHKVRGVDKPIRLCSEWINLSDRSGQTHTFQRDTSVVEGADGRLYFDHGPQVDYRIVVLGIFFLVIISAGIMSNRYLIARYRARLEERRDGASTTS